MQVIARSHATSTHAVATAVAEAGLESVTAIQAGKAPLATKRLGTIGVRED